MSAKTAQVRAQAPAPAWGPRLGVAARLLVGAVFLFSGLHKAAAPAEEFMVVLEGYQILPAPHIGLFARLIPWLEVVAGLFLLAGNCTRAAAAACAALSAAFFGALLSTQARGIELANCGCFGTSVHLERWQAMLLDAAMLALAVAAWRWGARSLSVDRWVEGGR